MTPESGRAPPGISPRPPDMVLALLRRAQGSAWGALAADIVLVGLFLWGIDPSNPTYSLSVIAGTGVFFGLVILALLLPVLTIGSVSWLRAFAVRGDWTRVRRNLLPAVCVGYTAWIIPGFFLHETLRLLDSPAWREPEAPHPRSVP